MKWKRIVRTVLLAIVLNTGSGCDRLNGQAKPQASEPCSLELLIPEKISHICAGMATTGECLIALSQDDFLRAWDWDGLNESPVSVSVPHWERYAHDVRFGVYLVGGQIVIASPQEKGTPLVLVEKDTKGDNEKLRWDLGVGVECCRLRPSSNGRTAILVTEEIHSYVLKQDRADKGDYRIGLVTPGESGISWLATIKTYESGPHINTAVVSPDMEYFAAVGYYEGGWVYVGSIEEKKELWRKRPDGANVPLGGFTVNFNDCCFSADSKRLYVAGNMGLFCFDVESGKILTQWPSNGRFVRVEVSPDGKYVAAGNTLTGTVDLWEGASEKHVYQIKTGQYTVYGLAFSPDSRKLATSGTPPENPSIKIWEIAELLSRKNAAD